MLKNAKTICPSQILARFGFTTETVGEEGSAFTGVHAICTIPDVVQPGPVAVLRP